VLKGLNPQQRAERSHRLEANLLQHLTTLEPLSVVGLYLPLWEEPRWDFARWAMFPWQLAFPAAKEGEPQYRLPVGQIPAKGAWVGMDGPLAHPDVLVVPGLAFSPHGWRLGRGGGWYDRLLEHERPRHGCIGVCFEEQLRDGWEPEAHDRKMDVIVTDARVWQCPRDGD
jgi:5,10-methenyltetrahydrofolate synthetase